MKRIVEPELLDRLPPDDPRAVHSRHDLRRVNAWMRHHAIMARALQKNWSGPAPGHVTELGAGDGNFLLGIAQKVSPHWPEAKATLLDLQKNISTETLAAFTAQGWRAEAIVADVFDWPRTLGGSDVIIANLFLHHFEDAQLAGLLRQIAGRAKLFVALEPRRTHLPLFCSRLLWAIGCNDVTRHDAVVSVRAGFCGRELSRLWPDKQHWQLAEQPAGAFSHLFVARKTN